MIAYVKYFDKNSKHIIFLVNDEEILENNEVWNKVKNAFKKKFDTEPVYNDKYIKAKINLHDTNFYDNKATIEDEHYASFSVILLDSVINVNKKYYPQIYLKVKKKKNMQ